jgi:hypothetical protein
MRVKERFRWTGRVRVTVGREVWESDNLITDDGVDCLVLALMGENAEINYLAWGDDDTAPQVGNTVLGNELGRKLITTQTPGDPGECITTAYLGPQDANGQIEEFGWIVGGTSLPDTGILIARILYSRLKTNMESIQVDRTDTLGAA